jgi:putative toxin-antitoxin system antitoxin component (TIGR02293 family)
MARHRSTQNVEPAGPHRASNRRVDDTLDSIIERATDVLGDRVAVMRWFGTPVRALDFATPISVLGTREGATQVADVLGQMEYGVW